MKQIRFVILGLSILVVGGCTYSYEDSKAAREQLARQNQGDIVIGSAWSFTDTHFLQGVDLATQEVNGYGQSGYGIPIENQRRMIRIVKMESSAQNTSSILAKRISARNIARTFAAIPEVVAVIGHRSSSLALPASITYEYNGLIFFAPTATNLMLTNHDFKYVFRMLPNNEEMGNQIAAYCHYYKKYTKMIVLNDRGDYGEELANSFVTSAVNYGIEIVYRLSFFPRRKEFAQLIADLKDKEFEAIFLSTGIGQGGKIIRQSRRMGIMQDFVGGDALGAAERLWKEAGTAAKGTVAPTVFNNSLKIVERFTEQFQEEYPGTKPDHYAALGYDTIKLLSYAMEKAQSTVPIEVATYLHYMSEGWKGVTGLHRFKVDGEIHGKQLYFMELNKVCDNKGNCEVKYKLMPEAHLPYLYYSQDKSQP